MSRESYRCQLFLSTTSLFAAYLDRDGKLVSAHSTIPDWPGFPPAALRGKKLPEIFGEENDPFLRPLLRRAQRGERANAEGLLRFHDGNDRRVAVTVVPDTVQRGACAIAIEDRNELFALRDKLDQREVFFKTLADANILGTYLADGTHFLEANETFLRMLGYTRDDLNAGRLKWRLMTPPENRPADLRCAREIISTGRCEPYEKSFYRKNGKTVPVLISGVELSKAPFRAIGFVVDLSQQKKSEAGQELLSEATLLLSSSFDCPETLTQLAKLIVQRSSDGCRIDLLNEQGTADRMVVAYRDPNPDDALKDLTEKLRLPRTGGTELFKVGPRSGLTVPIATGGKTLGALTLIGEATRDAFDESDFKITEELARRTAIALDNSRLYREAQRANRAKSKFLANISHEIRTPLNSILGFTEILLEPSRSAADRLDAVGTIRRNGQQLTELVSDLLDLAKIEAGHMQVEMLSVSPTEIVREVIALLSPQAKEKKLQLESLIDGLIPRRILCDPTRLRQILINVINNALKFTEHGKVSVTLKWQDGPPDQSYLHFDIRDTGTGIPDAEQKRLFQPFMQADSSISRKFGGTGLGLALSQSFCRALKGDVLLIESKVNQGSLFRVSLPTGTVSRTELDDSFALKAPLGIATPDFGSKQLKGLTILVADDCSDNQCLLNHFLGSAGATVEVASNGSEAVSKALLRNYALILMDIQMPVMDGFEATRELRRRGYSHPIIALSAHAMKEDRERCLAAGCNDHLTKPIDRLILIEKVAYFARLKAEVQETQARV